MSMAPVPFHCLIGGTAFSTESPCRNRYGTLVYDADLHSWLKYGGDCAAIFDGYIQNGVPPEVIIRFCKELGVDCWVVSPQFALDPMTDYMPSWFSSIQKRTC